MQCAKAPIHNRQAVALAAPLALAAASADAAFAAAAAVAAAAAAVPAVQQLQLGLEEASQSMGPCSHNSERALATLVNCILCTRG